MNIGRLDSLITIQSKTTVQDAAGQEIETWAEFATVWANRKGVKGSERFVARQELAARAATYRIRWISGVDEQMRVVDGSTYEIKGISGDRRKGWLELACEALNPDAT